MSQDAVKVAPEIYRVLLENDRLRVLEAVVKPRRESEMHPHPPNVTYVLSGGGLIGRILHGRLVQIIL
jgi:quercetin dioxygenase-like cupin family protein